jgi:hypothetical protein
MKRIMAALAVGLLSVAGCSSDAPTTDAPSGFLIKGYLIGPNADLGYADLTNETRVQESAPSPRDLKEVAWP